jgi:hypothetical protein
VNFNDYSLFGGNGYGGLGYKDFIVGSNGNGLFAGHSAFGTISAGGAGIKANVLGFNFDLIDYASQGKPIASELKEQRLQAIDDLSEQITDSGLQTQEIKPLVEQLQEAKNLEMLYGTENAVEVSNLKTSLVIYELNEKVASGSNEFDAQKLREAIGTLGTINSSVGPLNAISQFDDGSNVNDLYGKDNPIRFMGGGSSKGGVNNQFNMGRNNNTISGRAESISNKIGKNSVTIDYGSGRMRVDLKGKSHFDKSTQTYIQTPHVVEYQKNINPNNPNQADFSKGFTRPATHSDLRIIQQYLKRLQP